jgi:uncharacterized membrane protein
VPPRSSVLHSRLIDFGITFIVGIIRGRLSALVTAILVQICCRRLIVMGIAALSRIFQGILVVFLVSFFQPTYTVLLALLTFIAH